MTLESWHPRDLPEQAAIKEAEALRQDYPDDAVSLLEDFVEGHPTSLPARLHLAALYGDDYGLGIAGAERVLREILKDYPDCVPAMWYLALLHGHPHSSVTGGESLRWLEQAASIVEDADLIRNLANKAWEIGERGTALSAFHRLKALAPEARHAYFTVVADQALERIARGETPSGLVYTWPEVESWKRSSEV